MKILRLLVVLCVAGLALAMAQAKTLRVPQDYEYVYEAVQAAVAGDEVVLAPGSHRYAFVVNKAILVRSTDPTDPEVVKDTICAGYTMQYTTLTMNGSGIVDGLTIQESDNDAIRCLGGRPTIRRCIIPGGSDSITTIYDGCNALFEGNEIFGAGSYPAIKVNGNAAPTFRNNYMHNNTGGSIDCSAESWPTIEGNTFVTSYNSMVKLYRGEITNNVFRNCTARDGGAIAVLGQAWVTGNLIVGCSARRGGAIYCSGEAYLEKNTLCDNYATETNGGGHLYLDNAAATIRNCLIAYAGSGGGVAVSGAVAPQASYCNLFSNVGGNWIGASPGGDGMTAVDPLLADREIDVGQYRLKSQGGRWNGYGWVTDTVTSPCIDAGDPSSAYNFEPAPNGGRVNIGYDGNTAHASKSGGAVPSVIVCAPRGSGIAVGVNIIARFSCPMKQGSVQNNLYINGAKVTGGTFTWLGTKMTYNPPVNFQPGRRYQVRIARAALSRLGVKMAADKIWNFTTAAAAPPQVAVTAMPAPSGAQLALNLTAAADVTVSIRNLAGREIALLSPGALQAGVHSLVWNGRSQTGTLAPAGTYLVQVQAKGATGANCSALAVLKR